MRRRDIRTIRRSSLDRKHSEMPDVALPMLGPDGEEPDDGEGDAPDCWWPAEDNEATPIGPSDI